MPLRLNRLPLRELRQLHVELAGFVRGRLWLQVLIAMALGVGAGLALGPDAGWVDPTRADLLTRWLALPGQVFLALVQMIVIPLVLASIILGMAAGGDVEGLRRTGLRAVGFFLAGTLAAVAIGIAVALLVQPGKAIDSSLLEAAQVQVQVPAEATAPSLADLPSHLLQLLPTNPLRAGVEQNMMQVVLFAVLIGLALMSLPGVEARPLLDLLRAVQGLAMVVVRWAMYLVPLAVFGLLAQIVARLGIDALLGVGLYVLTVLLGLLLMLGLYLLVYSWATRRSPLEFLRISRVALLLAFSTSSSAAVMPLTLRTAERGLGVDAAVARFVIPLGTTINMAGTALYQVVATLFLAQVFGIDLGLSALLLVVALAVGASIGSPGTPGIGIVILAMLLDSVGIPAAGIALIIGVDRILDMARTTVNVAGDLVASCVVQPRRTVPPG
ncbi:MAG: dicarboxylate/amino acid:cation symporter [Aquimonas sp.]|nr:dicarboxylate/amino acid:cation symporter [Aquimonas sp.]